MVQLFENPPQISTECWQPAAVFVQSIFRLVFFFPPNCIFQPFFLFIKIDLQTGRGRLECLTAVRVFKGHRRLVSEVWLLKFKFAYSGVLKFYHKSVTVPVLLSSLSATAHLYSDSCTLTVTAQLWHITYIIHASYLCCLSVRVPRD